MRVASRLAKAVVIINHFCGGNAEGVPSTLVLGERDLKRASSAVRGLAWFLHVRGRFRRPAGRKALRFFQFFP